MDKINELFEKDLLFDFYSILLSENQKRIYTEVVFNDYSISEIAKDEGVSRQSVSEMIKRCDKYLLEYEDKLNIVKRFKKINEIHKRLLDIYEELNDAKLVNTKQIDDIKLILKEFDNLYQ